MTYSSITIIYNPNSTGDSEQQARDLSRTLQKSLKKTPIECVATEYAGHAEKLARNIAKKDSRPLIVSSSGDGGYNEVVNGVITAKDNTAICAVLPAGNANDHSRTLQNQPLAKSIIAQKITAIDLLEVRYKSGNKQTVRYAHSYAGLGLTPVVAVELNKHSLNSLKEAYIVLKTFFKYQPFKISHDNKTYQLDSLLFANINQMAKVLTIAPRNRPNDGKFEIVMFPSDHKWGLVKRLAKATVSKLENVEQATNFSFTTSKKMPMQLDGEVLVLLAGSQVSVTCKPKSLRTII